MNKRAYDEVLAMHIEEPFVAVHPDLSKSLAVQPMRILVPCSQHSANFIKITIIGVYSTMFVNTMATHFRR